MKYEDFWKDIKVFDSMREKWNSESTLPKKFICIADFITRSYEFSKFFVALQYILSLFVCLFLLFCFVVLLVDLKSFELFPILIGAGVLTIIYLLFDFEKLDKIRFSQKRFNFVCTNSQKVLNILEKDIKCLNEFTQSLNKEQDDLYEKMRKSDKSQAREFVSERYADKVSYIDLIKDDAILIILSKEVTREIADLDLKIEYTNEIITKLEEQKTFFETL